MWAVSKTAHAHKRVRTHTCTRTHARIHTGTRACTNSRVTTTRQAIAKVLTHASLHPMHACASHTRQAIAKAVEGANRIYLTAHGHIALVGQAAVRSRAPARHTHCAHMDVGTERVVSKNRQIRGVGGAKCAETAFSGYLEIVPSRSGRAAGGLFCIQSFKLLYMCASESHTLVNYSFHITHHYRPFGQSLRLTRFSCWLLCP